MSQSPYEPPATAIDEAAAKLPVAHDSRVATVMSVVSCALPLLHYGYVFVFWLLASAALGDRARPGINDPRGFGFGIPLAFSTCLMVLSFAVAPLVIVLGLRRNRVAIHVLAYGICLAVAIVLFRLDILQITTWIAD